ncbi:MAG: hypothetical protein ACTTJH_00380 [Bacteroidales bacterium]
MDRHIWYPEDSTTIKNLWKIEELLYKIIAFLFIRETLFGKSLGPIAFYYGEDDKIAFMDFEYYGERPIDDQFPIQIAKDLGWKCYTSTIEYE